MDETHFYFTAILPGVGTQQFRAKKRSPMDDIAAQLQDATMTADGWMEVEQGIEVWDHTSITSATHIYKWWMVFINVKHFASITPGDDPTIKEGAY